MKVIYKSYKFKIATDNEQKELLSKHFGACRFVFNRYLNGRKGSNSRLKQKSKLATIHEKVTNIRKDYLHKVSTEIIKNHDAICIKDF